MEASAQRVQIVADPSLCVVDCSCDGAGPQPLAQPRLSLPLPACTVALQSWARPVITNKGKTPSDRVAQLQCEEGAWGRAAKASC